MVWLVGWVLVGWLVGGVGWAGWLVGWLGLVGWLVGWLVGCWVGSWVVGCGRTVGRFRRSKLTEEALERPPK